MIVSRLIDSVPNANMSCQINQQSHAILSTLLTVLQSEELAKSELPKVIDEAHRIGRLQGCGLKGIAPWLTQIARRHAVALRNQKVVGRRKQYVPVSDPMIIDYDAVRLDCFLSRLTPTEVEIIRSCYVFGGAELGSLDGSDFGLIRARECVSKAVTLALQYLPNGTFHAAGGYAPLACEYVLGVLSPEDRQQANQLMQHNFEFQAAVAIWENFFSPFNHIYGVRVEKIKDEVLVSAALLVGALSIVFIISLTSQGW